MSTAKPLTDRQRQVYEWLLDFVLRRHHWPTISEMCTHFGRSRNAMHQTLRVLSKKGWLIEYPHRSVVKYSFAGVQLVATPITSV